MISITSKIWREERRKTNRAKLRKIQARRFKRIRNTPKPLTKEEMQRKRTEYWETHKQSLKDFN